MATITATKDNFSQLAHSSDVMLVDFWAEWCGPCKKFGPIFENASEKHKDVVFAKVDTDAEQELASNAGIMSIPTIFAIKEGVIVESVSGVMSPRELDGMIERTTNADVSKYKNQHQEAKK